MLAFVVLLFTLLTGSKLTEAYRWTGLPCSSSNYSGKNVTTWHQTTEGEWHCCVEILCPAGQFAVPCEKGKPTSTNCLPCRDNTYLSHSYRSSVGHKCDPISGCKGLYGYVKVDNGNATRDARCLCDLSRGFYSRGQNVDHHTRCYGPKNCSVGQQLVQNGSCVQIPDLLKPVKRPDKKRKVATTPTPLSDRTMMPTGVSEDYHLSETTDRNAHNWQMTTIVLIAILAVMSLAIVVFVFVFKRKATLTKCGQYVKRRQQGQVRSQSESEMEEGDGGGGTQRTGGAGAVRVRLLEEDGERDVEGNSTGNDPHSVEEADLAHPLDEEATEYQDAEEAGANADPPDYSQGRNEGQRGGAQDSDTDGAAVDTVSETLVKGAESTAAVQSSRRHSVDEPLISTGLQRGDEASSVRSQGQGRQHPNVHYHLHLHTDGDINIKDSQIGPGSQMYKGPTPSMTPTPSQSSGDEQDDISIKSHDSCDSSSLNDN